MNPQKIHKGTNILVETKEDIPNALPEESSELQRKYKATVLTKNDNTYQIELNAVFGDTIQREMTYTNNDFTISVTRDQSNYYEIDITNIQVIFGK